MAEHLDGGGSDLAGKEQVWQEVERRPPHRHTLGVALWASRARSWTEVPAPWGKRWGLLLNPGVGTGNVIPSLGPKKDVSSELTQPAWDRAWGWKRGGCPPPNM